MKQLYLGTGVSNLKDNLLVREIFLASRCHTYRTVFEPFNFSQEAFESKMPFKFDIEPFGQNEMTRNLSYKYDIEKQEKSLPQATCPISLTAL